MNKHTHRNRIKVIDSSGREFKSLREACKYHNKSINTVYGRIKAGMDIAEALDRPVQVRNKGLSGLAKVKLDNGCSGYKDSSGKVFHSLEEACEEHNICRQTVCCRLNNGWNFIEALETPVRQSKGRIVTNPDNKNEVIDSKGNVFKSLKEACIYHNISYATVNKRLTKGMSRVEALEIPVGSIERNSPAAIVYTDSKGRSYNSFTKACKAWGISQTAARDRLKNGMSLRDAIETPPGSICNLSKKVKLKNGKEFDSQKEAYEYYGVTRQAIHQRMKKNNLSFEEALYSFINKKPASFHKKKNVDLRAKKYIDSRGRTFNKLSDVYSFYEISANKVKSRLQSGWRLVDAIETPTGGLIESNVRMFYKIKHLYSTDIVSHETVLDRLRNGWEFARAISIPE